MNDNNNWGQRRHYFRWFALGFFLLIALAIGLSLYFGFFVTRPIGYPGFYYPYPFPFFFFPFGLLFGLFFIFVIFWVVRAIFWPRRWGWGYSRRYWGYGSEYYILRQRYAR